MYKFILVVLLITISSCIIPYETYNEEPIYRPVYKPVYYQPTKVIVIKKKPHNKRHIKVKINKHRKTKR